MKYRFLQSKLPATTGNTLTLLTGARQTGKTVLSQFKYPGLTQINLDAPENREIVRKVHSDVWGKDIGNAVIDEAQKEPVVFDKVKYAFDKGDISFSLLTGSSQILLLKKIRESLAGRIKLYELWPLMMSELCYERHDTNIQMPLINEVLEGIGIDTLCNSVPTMLLPQQYIKATDAETYLLTWGGMPALLSVEEQDERRKWLRDYCYLYLERDLADLACLDNLEPFTKFQKLSSLRSAKILNFSEIARDAMVSVDTARRYMEYLTLSYQTFLLQPYYRNITSSVIKSPKIYWVDIGILRHLTGFINGISGSLYETMVVSETVKWNKTLQKNAGLYYYRTRSGLECDMLIETPSGITGMEVKMSNAVSLMDATPMRKLAEKLDAQWQGGIIAYTGDVITKICEPGIWAIPSKRLFI